MIRVARPYFRKRKLILKEIDKILESGRLMDGCMGRDFENEFALYTGTKYAIAVNSCTTALEIALRFLNIKGKEVIVPTNTFIATCNAILFAGGKPILADIKNNSYNIDPKEIEKRITRRTKAVIVVHVAGFICEDILEIQRLCKKKGLYLIEDCAHAVGAIYNGRKAGSFGFAGCFSFYPTKIMTTGTGGMITTDFYKLNDFAKSVRCHGRGSGMDNIVNMGNDWFMDEIKAVLGLYQLRDVDNMISKRRKIASYYIVKLKEVKKINIFITQKDCIPNYYKFPVQLNGSIDVDCFKKGFLSKYNFELESAYWPPCHLQPLYKKLFGYRKGDFPVAERILQRQITLPMHPLITEKEIDFVISKLKVALCK